MLAQINAPEGVNTQFRRAYGNDPVSWRGKLIETRKGFDLFKHDSPRGAVYTINKDLVFQAAFRSQAAAHKWMKDRDKVVAGAWGQ